MFTIYGFTTYKKKTVMMLLSPYTPFKDPGAGYLPLDAYYICSHKARKSTAGFITLLKEKGIDAEILTEPVYKKLAVRAGVAAILGTNSLVYNYYHGSRFFLSAIEISYQSEQAEHEFEQLMSELGAKRAEAGEITQSVNCHKCGKCIKACPLSAISYNGFDPSKCMRTYMADGIPDIDAARKMGGAFWGCDICQRVCPHNRTEAVPMPNALKKLLKIEDFLKNPKKHTDALAEYIGANYADKNRLLALCINAAGNSGNKAYAPLITPHLKSQSAAVAAAAERALVQVKT